MENYFNIPPAVLFFEPLPHVRDLPYNPWRQNAPDYDNAFVKRIKDWVIAKHRQSKRRPKSYNPHNVRCLRK